jgi:DMSO/TMAO reductase YedYZ molybdopterin-dependent catalytic subunit
MTRLGWLAALIVASIATVAALLLQTLLRDVWQIRTLPERVMEWLLLFVPPNAFEHALALFGDAAKEITLTATLAAMGVALVAIGAFALGAGWSSSRVLGLGIGLWLATMVIVMPITGAGFFATRLLISPLLTDAGYLLVFLGYSSALVAGRLGLLERPDSKTVVVERRALLLGLIATLAAGGAAKLASRNGGLVVSTLPIAVAPTSVLTVRQTAQTANSEATQPPTALGTPAPAPTATPEPLPNPPPPRQLARDKDGSLTAAGRPKGELAPLITANEDFYVVTKNAIQDPIVDAATWRLIIDGEVNTPVQVDYRTLRALPPVQVTKTLECISNFTAACNLTSFGCDLISTAQWRGARLSDVLALAGGLKSSSVSLAFLSADEFSAGLASDVVKDPETLVAYEMNGEPLPREHGFPARLLVPGRYGMKNPKWLAGIRAMTQEYTGWYEQRNWNKDGIVKTMSRIDTPADGAMLSSGQQRIAGIAYAGNRGVSKVELTNNDGATWWLAQLLEPMAGTDAMIRWESTFSMPTAGGVTLTVRATDGGGEVQTDEFQLPQPDGGSGRDAISVFAA